MGCTRSNRGVFKYAAETTYGDGGGAVPTYYTARLSEPPDTGDLGVTAQQLTDVMATDLEGDIIRVPTPSSMGIKRVLRALQTVVPATEYAVATQFVGHLDSDLIAQTLGGFEHGGFGTVTGAASTTTSVVLDTGGGATFDGGSIIRVVSTTGRIAFGLVKSVSTDTLTLHWALPFIPATGSLCLGGRLLFKSEPAGSFGAVWEGENLDDVRRGIGAQINSLKLTGEENTLMTLEASLFIAKYDAMVSGTDHGGIVDAAESFPTPIQARDGGLWIVPYTVGTNTYGTPIRVQGGIELDLGVEAAPVTGVHGDAPNGVAGQCVIRRKARLTCSAPVCANYVTGQSPAAGEGNYWQSAFAAGSKFGVIYWAGSGYGNVCCVIPCASLVDEPKQADKDGRAVIPLTFKEEVFAGDSGAGAPKNSTLRILFPAGTVA